MRLKDKVAIVTGATSGMGRATAVLFAREGAKVMISGRNEERAKAVVDQIKSEGFEASYILVDTAKLDDLHKIVDKTVELYGTVDILFNNAGKLSLSGVLDVSMEEWDEMFKVNVASYLKMAQLVAPIMKAKGKGVI
ncbi:MAG: SDR family NAD(P)-dependent oxidoreductase, partial [Eubacteriaceae bacterium]|nr:SDR family NAD(P)-dependent oxidoreductase [Eubacteriaceae bacterium]